MKDKSVQPVFLIEAGTPIVKDWKSQSFNKLTESDWTSLEQEAEKKLALNPLDINVLHLCALRIRANHPLPSCFKTVMDQQKELAKQGKVEAMVYYGYFLYLLEEHDEAIQQFYSAMQKGSAEAMYNWGKMYEFGLGSEVEIDSALLLYYHAAKKGLNEAFLALKEKNEGNSRAKLYLYLVEVFSSNTIPSLKVGILNCIKSLATNNPEVYPILFDEIATVLRTNEMGRDEFLFLFDLLFKVIFTEIVPEHIEKIWTVIAIALQKSYLSWAQVCLHKKHVNIDRILNALRDLDARQIMSDILLSDIVLSLDPKSGLSEVQAKLVYFLLNGTDLVSVLFKEAFQFHLKMILSKFQENPSLHMGILQFLDSLPKCSEVRPIFHLCVDLHVNDLIARHRARHQEEDVTELKKYSRTVPRAARYLESVKDNFSHSVLEEHKDKAVKGDKASIDYLFKWANCYPEAMYWLGRYYEEAPRGYLSLNYDSKVINCYKSLLEMKEPISDHCRLLAYERLALCYQEGKFVKKDLEQAYYYHYKASVLGSTNSIIELANAFGDARVVILANLYLAMLKGFKGKLSEYYNNTHLITAINLHKDITETVIVELSRKDEFDIHHRMALLQAAFHHNTYINGAPHQRMLELFKSFYHIGGFPADHETKAFIEKLADYINPYYFVDIIAQLADHFCSNFINYYTYLYVLAGYLSYKLKIDKDQLGKQVPSASDDLYSYFDLNNLSGFIDEVIYRASSNPVQTEQKRGGLSQEIDRASPFGQDDEFVDKSDVSSAPSVLTTLSSSAMSFISRGGSFLSTLGRKTTSTEVDSKGKELEKTSPDNTG